MEAHERVNESAAVILACQDAADVQAADADDINHICSHADHRVLPPRGSEGRCLGRCSCWILRSSCLLQEVYAFAVLVALDVRIVDAVVSARVGIGADGGAM